MWGGLRPCPRAATRDLCALAGCTESGAWAARLAPEEHALRAARPTHPPSEFLSVGGCAPHAPTWRPATSAPSRVARNPARGRRDSPRMSTRCARLGPPTRPRRFFLWGAAPPTPPLGDRRPLRPRGLHAIRRVGGGTRPGALSTPMRPDLVWTWTGTGSPCPCVRGCGAGGPDPRSRMRLGVTQAERARGAIGPAGTTVPHRSAESVPVPIRGGVGAQPPQRRKSEGGWVGRAARSALVRSGYAPSAERISALVGTPVPAVARAVRGRRSSWFTASPRIWRAASVIMLKPCR